MPVCDFGLGKPKVVSSNRAGVSVGFTRALSPRKEKRKKRRLIMSAAQKKPARRRNARQLLQSCAPDRRRAGGDGLGDGGVHGEGS